ncbi:hypothetical protein CG51_19205 [Haematobacter missouriensis]|uniref:FUSC family protein n=1 Tax=Haematobacter missouriensis TaxID=366616 RepID=A0A212AJ23_9RHOB|nr:FUSC family protein [Haematobacter missouriensis]KFI32969.1 hypothetical protein CG51_19205 [Haematobacter missouriensis]OWJ74112.1 FUSC family protein [Haematobacter missouriensis]OWJ81479.1 FUSC family protein [Haematobacter missouriensis]
MASLLSRLGIDAARLRFTGLTALAACLSLVAAWALGLEHPQWSAMSVWAAALPVRGQLVEKAANRFLGTVVGALFGMGLMVVSGGDMVVLVVGIALWLGLCAGIGNVIRGFAAYGAMLAGYSAAMVALLDTGHPENVLDLGLDRMATVLVGVAIALAVGWVFGRAADRSEPYARVRVLTRSLLTAAAATLRGVPADAREATALLSEMASIEDTLDTATAGSRRARRSARATRWLLSGQVGLMLWLRSEREGRVPRTGDAHTAAALDTAAAAIDRGDDISPVLRAAAAEAGPALARALTALADAPWQEAGRADPAPVHRDWRGGREAAIRAVVTMLVVGGIWIVTGWSFGAYMMLGASIMTSVFSSFDNPSVTIRTVLLGQALGALGALAVRWLLWPLASGEFGLILLMMPAILIGALLMAQRRMGQAAYDYNMVVMLMLQPVWPLTMSLSTSITAAVAVVLGPLAGLVAFRLIYPVDGVRRLTMLRETMVTELTHLAREPQAAHRASVWRARLHHRVLRLVRWSEKLDRAPVRAADGGLAVLTLGRAILHLHDLSALPLSPPQTRRVRAVLERLSRLDREPRKAARALRKGADALAAVPSADVRLLRAAADGLEQNIDFFQLGTGVTPSGGASGDPVSAGPAPA